MFFRFSPGEIEVCEEEGTELLGAPISFSENFYQNFMVEKVNKVEKLHGKLTQLWDSQMSYLLLKSCLDVSKLGYLLRVVNPNFNI